MFLADLLDCHHLHALYTPGRMDIYHSIDGCVVSPCVPLGDEQWRRR